MKTTRFKSLAAAFALGALALAGAPAVAQDASLKVEDAWVRATVPSQHATGVFMRLTSPTAARGHVLRHLRVGVVPIGPTAAASALGRPVVTWVSAAVCRAFTRGT